MEKLLVIDGNSILNRAFYGIRPLTNKDGLNTNAVYGMISIISKHIDSLKPDYAVVAFDMRAPTFRHKYYELYKANRKGMPEELAEQMPYAVDCMSALGFKVMRMEGYEADDILGTVSARAAERGIHAYVLTGDRDSLQLIDDNISVLLVKTKETIEFDRDVFLENYGVTPEQFVDVKALMGDTSDNIPGVAGIGEKTALKLIAEFGSLDSLYEKLSESSLSEKTKEKLFGGKDSAYLSQYLAKINCESPIENDIEDCKYNGINKQELYKLFTQLEFSAFIKKFGLESETIASTEEFNEIEKPTKISFEKSSASSAEVVAAISGKEISVSLNNDGIEAFDGEKLFSLKIDKTTFEALKNSRIICHDFKSLYKEFYSKGFILEHSAFDTMLAAYVLDSNRGKYTLDEVYLRYIGEAMDESLPSAVACFELYRTLEPKIKSEELENLLFNIELPLSAVLAEMELFGFKIDVSGIRSYGEELSAFADALALRIYSFAGEEFNINSPKRLGEVLFEKMGLPAPKKTKTGYSTDAETLKKLLPYHEIITDILDYRHFAKLKSTYADGLVAAADENGRVHSVFNQTGTATGRLSSSEPNLQNIPVRTEIGRKFRKYFVPENDGYVIIDADYSQIELRLLAHIAEDEAMRGYFLSGEDIHTMTASRVFGVSPEDVTAELRKRAKAVNFGILYGIGEYSLSEDLGISRVQAKNYIESYLNGFPSVSQYLENVKTQARENGYVTTEFGRKRYIPEISAKNKNLQHFGERVAMNSPIQGTAADIIKIAMVSTARRLRESGLDARLILQVHDELLIEAKREDAEKALEILVECMENAVEFSVPLNVDAHIGDTWYEAK